MNRPTITKQEAVALLILLDFIMQRETALSLLSREEQEHARKGYLKLSEAARKT